MEHGCLKQGGWEGLGRPTFSVSFLKFKLWTSNNFNGTVPFTHHFSLTRQAEQVRQTRCYRKFDCSEILSRRSYFLGNFITKCDFFLGNIIAARKFDRSPSHRNERLLLSILLSNLIVTSGRAFLESVASRVSDCYSRNGCRWELRKIVPCTLFEVQR